MAVIFDVIYYVTGTVEFAMVAFLNIAAGVLAGLLAALPGFWDWLSIPSGTRAKSVGLYHGVGNVIVVAVFAAAWYLRFGDPAHLPTTTAFVLEIAAVTLALVTGWLGGELVERLGVGVDPGANLDAPTSTRPAR